jgi:hypothetical protein
MVASRLAATQEGWMDRAQKALAAIDLGGRGLEIGPSYNPLVPKSSGARVETVDHAGRDEVVAKYTSWGLDEERLSRIETVDHIWTEGSLLDVVEERGVYDYIVAAHVVEHTVDLVRFLRDCEQLLSDTGRLALIVPDKRYCSDRFRPVSTVGDVLEAHYANSRFHTVGAIADHQAYACRRGELFGWAEGELAPLALQFPKLEWMPEVIDEARRQEEYHDTHRWLFTPTSFRLLVSDLAALGYHHLGIAASVDTEGFEFFVTLGRGEPVDTDDRLGLLQQVEREVAEPVVFPVRRELELSELRLQAVQNAADVSSREHASALAERDITIGRQHETIAGMQALIDAQQSALADLHASTSWRLTWPVRAVSSALRRRR